MHCYIDVSTEMINPEVAVLVGRGCGRTFVGWNNAGVSGFKLVSGDPISWSKVLFVDDSCGGGM